MTHEPPASVERGLPEHLIERSGRKVLAVMNADPCPEPCLSWPCECAYRFAKAALGASTPPARPGRESLEDVERVARALRNEEWGSAGSWDDADKSDREYWLKSARAALGALFDGAGA